jgi:DNA-directed RNA polymerase subunit RPC12/RpoP
VSDFLRYKGRSRTDVACTNCPNVFLALLDYDIDGCHVIRCPYCGHEHFRVIKAGKITEDRWNGQMSRVSVNAEHIRKVAQAPSTTCHFIRDRWMNFGQDDDA